MDALVTAFIAAILGEFGDKSQLLVAALAARWARPAPLLFGVLIAALLSSAIAAVGGSFVHSMMILRASSLLIGVALLFGGVSALVRRKPVEVSDPGRMPLFLVAAIYVLASEMGDKTQFVTFALTAYYDSPMLAAIGASAGIVAASVPAAFAGKRLGMTLPLGAIRIAIGVVFIAAGLFIGLNALRLL